MCEDMKTSGYEPVEQAVELAPEHRRDHMEVGVDASVSPEATPVASAEERDHSERYSQVSAPGRDDRSRREASSRVALAEEHYSDKTLQISIPEQDDSQSRVEAYTERVSAQENNGDVSADCCTVPTSQVFSSEYQFIKMKSCTSQASLPDRIDSGSDKFRKLETDEWCDSSSHVSLPEVEGAVEPRADRWSDSQVSPPEEVTSDTEPMAAVEPSSDMYYTASSEVSLLSDVEVPATQMEDSVTESMQERCVLVAGHVAAMRERFESMTRANTPCPELAPQLDVAPSLSPQLDVAPSLSPQLDVAPSLSPQLDVAPERDDA